MNFPCHFRTTSRPSSANYASLTTNLNDSSQLSSLTDLNHNLMPSHAHSSTLQSLQSSLAEPTSNGGNANKFEGGNTSILRNLSSSTLQNLSANGNHEGAADPNLRGHGNLFR